MSRTILFLCLGTQQVSQSLFIYQAIDYYVISVCNAKSRFIRNATVDWGELNVQMVSCEFKDGIEGASCVLVYQEYGSKNILKTVFSLRP